MKRKETKVRDPQSTPTCTLPLSRLMALCKMEAGVDSLQNGLTRGLRLEVLCKIFHLGR